MPSIGLHLALTLFVLASCVKDEDLKSAFLLLPFGLLNDLDSLIGVHRATFHNLFTPFSLLFGLGILKRLKLSRISFSSGILASALVSLHIGLDLFYNGVFLFYPLTQKSYNPEFWFGLRETGLSTLFSVMVPGRVGELMYVVTPHPSVPEIPIIESGIELVILIFALLTFSFKFKETFLNFFIPRSAMKKIAR